MSSIIEDTKKYITVASGEFIYLFNQGYYNDYLLQEDVLTPLAKDLGFSYDLYLKLFKISKEAADNLVLAMSKTMSYECIHLLVDIESKIVLGYSLDSRQPILNSEFAERVESLIDTCPEVEIKEKYYLPQDMKSSMIIKKISPITLELKHAEKESDFVEYDIGVLIVNDEKDSAYTRLVVYVDDQPLYLPASYYNSTTSRFKRSTANSLEALEVLVLKVIDDLRDDVLKDKLIDFYYRHRINKDIVASYEEYNTLLRTMRRIPTIIEDNSFLESLASRYESFERKYAHLDDQKSSYIWRCTALSDMTIGSLVSITSKILEDLGAPTIEYFNVRDLLGSYVSTNRIAAEIAKEDIE